MQARAEARYVRTSARKARLVLDHIRGRTVPEARTILAFTQRAAALDVDKVLRSAVANAESAKGLDGDDLVVLDSARRRGADPQALARSCPRAREPHPQAHLPHHHRRRRGSGGQRSPQAEAEGRRRGDTRSTGRREAQAPRDGEEEVEGGGGVMTAIREEGGR